MVLDKGPLVLRVVWLEPTRLINLDADLLPREKCIYLQLPQYKAMLLYHFQHRNTDSEIQQGNARQTKRRYDLGESITSSGTSWTGAILIM